MKVNIIETITNILNEDRSVINTVKSEVYSIYPEKGKALYNKITKKISITSVTVRSKNQIKDYEDIDLPEEE